MTYNSVWKYRARPCRIVDGDTIVVDVDLGFNIQREITLRLSGLDTAEIHFVDHDSEEYHRGQRHKEFVERWMPDATEDEWPIIVETDKAGKYGRYIARVHRVSDDSVLNEKLIDQFGDELRRS